MSMTGDGRPGLGRRRFLAGTSATVAGLGAGHMTAGPAAAETASASEHQTEHPTGRRPPNVVVILADDLGYGELGCYGQQLVATPRLDQLAAEGLRFTDFYAGAPVCAPSRCTLLTGRHSGHCTVRDNPRGVPEDSALQPEDVTFAETLRAQGYRTAYFGKWGFGPEQPAQPSHPHRRGFDEFYGYITHRHAHSYYPDYLWHDDSRVDLPENAGDQETTFAPDLFAHRALDFISDNRDEPFLLFFSPNIPHFPNQAPSLAPYEDEPWTRGNKAHAAQVTLLDSYVGRIVDKLGEFGLDQETLVLVTADNGHHEEGGGDYDPRFFEAGGPLRGLKRNLYEGGIRVPLIAWSPRLLQRTAGRTSDHPWAFWDLFPTLADFAGAPVPDDLDGVSVRPVMTGASRGEHQPDSDLFWYRLDWARLPLANEADDGRVLNLAEAARRGRWKVVRFAPGKDRRMPDDEWDVELYDLDNDIGETANVAGQHPELVASLVARMRKAWADPPPQRPTWSPDGLAVDPPRYLVAGGSGRVETTLTNHGSTVLTDVRLDLGVGAGWVAEPLSAPSVRALPPGAQVRTAWSVTPPTDAEPGRVLDRLRPRATYTRQGRSVVDELPAPATVAPPAPTNDTYLSDLDWFYAANGWGPVERDMSNGGRAGGDGQPISLDGVEYDKGLGVHAHAKLAYHLGGRCTRFTSVVGVDDSVRPGGSVAFHVLADGEDVYGSGMVTGTTPPRSVDVDVAGVRVLELVVSYTEGSGLDHASWADAMVHCT